MSTGPGVWAIKKNSEQQLVSLKRDEDYRVCSDKGSKTSIKVKFEIYGYKTNDVEEHILHPGNCIDVYCHLIVVSAIDETSDAYEIFFKK